MEVDIVEMLVSDHTGLKLLDDTGLQRVQSGLSLWFFCWLQFDDYLESSTELGPESQES